MATTTVSASAPAGAGVCPKVPTDKRTTLYGTHDGITCDACACRPMQGYRYKCKFCKNHDICEACYAKFMETKVVVQNPTLERVNKVSKRAEDHEFYRYAEPDGSFKPMGGTAPRTATQKRAKKTKPNDPCPCGSGKKFKKCCRK